MDSDPRIVFPLVGGKTWTATWPRPPRPMARPQPTFDLSDLTIFHVAHGLSQVNRFCGQTPKPYSVAEHSVALSYLVPQTPRMIALALLHDAPEALGCADAHGALKKLICPAIREFEADLFEGIWWCLSRHHETAVSAAEHAELKRYDSLLGNFEARLFGFPSECNDADFVDLSRKFIEWNPLAAGSKQRFVTRWIRTQAHLEDY